jgi:hypothetical protein
MNHEAIKEAIKEAINTMFEYSGKLPNSMCTNTGVIKIKPFIISIDNTKGKYIKKFDYKTIKN